MQRDPDITIGWRVADNIQADGHQKGNSCLDLAAVLFAATNGFTGIIDRRTGIDVPPASEKGNELRMLYVLIETARH